MAPAGEGQNFFRGLRRHVGPGGRLRRLAEAGATARATGDEKKAKKRYRKAVKQAAAACTSSAAAAAALAEDLLTRVEQHDAPAEELPELRVSVDNDELVSAVDDAVTALAAGGVCLLEHLT